MKRRDRALLGALVVLCGLAIISPSATSQVLEASSTQDKKPDPEVKVATPKYGVIRSFYFKIIASLKSFWKWLW